MTDFITRPHPSGEFIAYRECDIDQEDGRVTFMGYGATREAAIADYLEQLED